MVSLKLHNPNGGCFLFFFFFSKFKLFFVFFAKLNLFGFEFSSVLFAKLWVLGLLMRE